MIPGLVTPGEPVASMGGKRQIKLGLIIIPKEEMLGREKWSYIKGVEDYRSNSATCDLQVK